MRLIDYDELEEYAVEYQERHEHDGGQLTRGEFKLIDSFMFECPKTDAIPVEWLKTQINEAVNDNETELASDIDWLIRRYIDEQEAR